VVQSIIKVAKIPAREWIYFEPGVILMNGNGSLGIPHRGEIQGNRRYPSRENRRYEEGTGTESRTRGHTRSGRQTIPRTSSIGDTGSRIGAYLVISRIRRVVVAMESVRSKSVGGVIRGWLFPEGRRSRRGRSGWGFSPEFPLPNSPQTISSSKARMIPGRRAQMITRDEELILGSEEQAIAGHIAGQPP